MTTSLSLLKSPPSYPWATVHAKQTPTLRFGSQTNHFVNNVQVHPWFANWNALLSCFSLGIMWGAGTKMGRDIALGYEMFCRKMGKEVRRILNASEKIESSAKKATPLDPPVSSPDASTSPSK